MKLTIKKLQAIEEALSYRLAGEIEKGPEWPKSEDYEKAHDWTIEQISKRKKAAK